MADHHGLETGCSRFQGTHDVVTAFRVGALVLEMGVNSADGGFELGQRSSYLGLNPKSKSFMALNIAVGADEYLHTNSLSSSAGMKETIQMPPARNGPSKPVFRSRSVLRGPHNGLIEITAPIVLCGRFRFDHRSDSHEWIGCHEEIDNAGLRTNAFDDHATSSFEEWDPGRMVPEGLGTFEKTRAGGLIKSQSGCSERRPDARVPTHR
jgi:hypothetical protein